MSEDLLRAGTGAVRNYLTLVENLRNKLFVLIHGVLAERPALLAGLGSSAYRQDRYQKGDDHQVCTHGEDAAGRVDQNDAAGQPVG